MWILILISLSGHIDHVEFKSQKACVEAVTQLREVWSSNALTAQCVRKGEFSDG